MRTLHSVSDVITSLGGIKSVSEISGAKARAITIWRWNGKIPAKMYHLLNDALAQQGCVADKAIFSFAQTPPNMEGESNETASA